MNTTPSPTKTLPKLADPQPVPQTIAVCPECGGKLEYQITCYDPHWNGLSLDCEHEVVAEGKGEDHHRWFQSDWQPVLDYVRKWLSMKFPEVGEAKTLAGVPIAIDFDGTCVTHEYPEIGRDIGAVPVLKEMVEQGALLILWTMRSGKQLDAAVNWFHENEIPLEGIQRNPAQDDWTASPKAYAKLYIDDAALGAPLRPGDQSGDRPYIDWKRVRTMLFHQDHFIQNA